MQVRFLLESLLVADVLIVKQLIISLIRLTLMGNVNPAPIGE